MLRRTEIPYRALRLDQRITTIETNTTRYLIFRGQRVTVLAKDPRTGARGAHGQTHRILHCTVPEIGRRWDYTVDLDGQALRRTTQVVDAISQYEGELAGVAVLDDDDAAASDDAKGGGLGVTAAIRCIPPRGRWSRPRRRPGW